MDNYFCKRSDLENIVDVSLRMSKTLENAGLSREESISLILEFCGMQNLSCKLKDSIHTSNDDIFKLEFSDCAPMGADYEASRAVLVLETKRYGNIILTQALVDFGLDECKKNEDEILIAMLKGIGFNTTKFYNIY